MPQPSAMADGMIAEAVAAGPGGAAGEPAAGSSASSAGADPAAAASDAAELVFATVPALLGPEWEPTPDERARCERAMRRYFEKYGAWDLPPGLALVAAFGIYGAKRMRFGFDKVFALLGMAPPAAAASLPADELQHGDGNPLNIAPGEHGQAA